MFQGQNMNPLPGSAPRGRGPPVKRHQNIHVNMEQERESVSASKEYYQTIIHYSGI